jgi:hypothetical protein
MVPQQLVLVGGHEPADSVTVDGARPPPRVLVAIAPLETEIGDLISPR